jgi:phenylpropionate dioxygenase-like ring-hydroxylating dioxygenase large terminal subunit
VADVAEKLDPEVLPEYVPSAVLVGEAREEAVRMMLRLADHVRNKTTDQAEGNWQEPVENYSDPELFRAEVETMFKRIPLPLALSCELPGKNSYKAIEAVGLPVVITRDAKGEVHAMLNVCRHRGALICGEGTGTSRALTCPYHAWSYGMDGELRGIYGESTFGDFDKSERNLVQLPVVEVAGLIFVCLTPGLEMDIDSWLGDFKPVLEGLKLDELHLFSSRMMPGPNWKVVIEGYLEGYHFASLHPNTVFKTNLSNTGIFDGYGPHERVGFALRNLENEINAGADVETLDPSANVGAIIWLFPGMSFAGAFRERMTCSLVLPTTSVDASMTEQRVFTRRPVTDENREDLEVFRDFFYDVTYGEDYITGYGVQKGVKAVPGTTQLYGRNEPGVQYVHQTINRIMKENHVDGMALPREAAGASTPA